MVTKNQIKLIKSLQQKKHRKLNGLFFVEGVKGIQELVQSNLKLVALYSTEAVDVQVAADLHFEISDADLKKISALTTPNNCLALFEIPQAVQWSEGGLTLVLDDVRDPGNMGTIIRLCDWFGIEHLVCSPQTVDAYNPKVVQATMGSITRVNVWYTELEPFLKAANVPVYGTFMDGDSLYQLALPANAIVVMGNEANGISADVESCVKQRLSIPRFGQLKQAESLNVATATAVILSEFSRSSIN